MPIQRFSEKILRHLAREGYKPKKVAALAREMGIADNEYGDFRAAVKALMRTGRVVLGSASAVTLPAPAKTLVGQFRGNPRGFGFVIPDTPNAHGDLYVPADHTGGAVTGDTVAARVLKRGKRAGRMIYEGHIVEIIRRGQSRFVGELCKELGRWFVRPDGGTLHAPVFVGDPKVKSARAGDQVVVEILQYPSEREDARGVIVRVLGKRGQPGVDTLSIIHQYQLPDEFPEEVLEETRRIVAAAECRPDEDREDLRKLTVITIDPDDARDYDDAISLTELPDGEVELGVHIADVSHFVRPDTELDREARERATSVYFPRHVIPMLPEALSNGLCSLQEREPRLAKSVWITYDPAGQRTASRFANTVIRSTKRLTYRQATQILDGRVGRYSKKVVALLQRMEVLARAIRQRRIAEGMLVLDLPEAELILDDDGRVTGAAPPDTSFSHTIIEMFMVEANEAVAELLAGLGVPAIRRVHAAPDAGAAPALTRFLRALGLPPLKSMDRPLLQQTLATVRDRPESFAVNFAILRALEQAVYTPALEGHFALASEHYLHFTSPIRRYPDLTVHRLLDEYVRGNLTRKRRPPDLPTLTECHEAATHCSNCARRAEAAERELRDVLILRLLEQELGAVYDGVVTGVTNFGVFVQLAEYLIDGLVRFADLPEDWWEVDTASGCVIGQRTGRRLKIGDRLRVATAGVDLANRRLDLVLADATQETGRRKGKPSAAGKAKKRKKARRQTTGRRPRR